MPTTTMESIRDTLAAAIEAIVPATHADRGFLRTEARIPFGEWVDAHPAACFRRFEIEGTLDYEGPLMTNSDLETLRTEIRIAVAYPTALGRYGTDDRRDMFDVIRGDLFAIRDVVGPVGQGNYPAGSLPVTVIEGTQTTTLGAAVIVETAVQIEFHRSI